MSLFGPYIRGRPRWPAAALHVLLYLTIGAIYLWWLCVVDFLCTF